MRLGQNGGRQRRPSKRAKSRSVLINSQPDSMARAASQASWTRLPDALAALQRSTKMFQ